MARNYETVQLELNDARAELASLAEISEKEICKCYNVDCKSEIVHLLKEEIEALEREAELLTPDEVYEPAYY